MIEFVDKHIKIDIIIVFHKFKKLNMLSGDIKAIKAQDPLVVQWLKSHLAMQGTLLRALAWEAPTGHRAAKPVCHSY